MENVTIKISGVEVTVVIFSNNVAVINSTPHPVTMQDMITGELRSVPTSVLVNARPVEKQVSALFVKTEFEGTPEGAALISEINAAWTETGRPETLVIVGSIIAAQAYPGEVVGMCPVPGYERVAPAEKRMRSDKFSTF